MNTMQKKGAIDHLQHVDYPASKEDSVKACDNISDVSEEDKKLFRENLPEETYQSVDEVKATLGMM